MKTLVLVIRQCSSNVGVSYVIYGWHHLRIIVYQLLRHFNKFECISFSVGTIYGIKMTQLMTFGIAVDRAEAFRDPLGYRSIDHSKYAYKW